MVINWEEKFLDELCIKISAGGDKPNSFSKIKTDKLNIPVYSNGIELNGLQGYTDKATITENAITISARGTIGFICKRLEPYCPIVRLISVIPKDDIYLDFLYYALHLMICNNSGSSIPQLTVPQLKKNKIKYPKNIDEQKRIAAKLDNAFQKIEALENNTKENIKNIEDLYNSYLNRIFTENTYDWEEKIFDKVCNIYTGNSINANIKKQKYSNLDNGYNYIATKDISFSNVINYENGIKIPKDEAKFKIAPKNSILLCIEGGSAGRKIGILKEDVCFVNKLCAFVIKYKYLNHMFVYYYLQSPKFKQIFYDNKTGLIGGVSLNKLKKLTIAFPKIEEQKKIVDKLDIFNNKIQTIKQNYQNKLTLLDNLKKSILNKAFKGEL